MADVFTEQWAADLLGIRYDVLPIAEFSDYQKERIACVLKGARAALIAAPAAQQPEAVTVAQVHALMAQAQAISPSLATEEPVPLTAIQVAWIVGKMAIAMAEQPIQQPNERMVWAAKFALPAGVDLDYYKVEGILRAALAANAPEA